jgi:TRAP-type uncharacterized transport system fused permease subunit
MMLTWQYPLPAFLVPFVLTLSAQGMGVPMQAPVADVLSASATAAVGVGALAAGLGGWIMRAASVAERLALVCGGLLLFYAAPWSGAAGFVMTAVVLILQFTRRPAIPAVER